MVAISCVNLVNVVFFTPKKNLGSKYSFVQAKSANDQNKEPDVLIVVIIFALAIFTYNFVRAFIVGVFPDIAKSKEYYDWTGIETGLILFFFGAARTVTFLFQYRIKNQALSASVFFSLFLSASSFIFIMTRELAVYCIFFSIIGVLSALVYSMTLQKMLHIPKGRGQAAGLFESGLALGGLVSPIFSGITLGIYQSPEAAFIVVGTMSTIVSLVALVLLVISRKKA